MPSTPFAGTVPANYDRYLGPLLFEPYALDMIERLPKGKLKKVLELACGTGRVTRHLASLIGENGQLVATDINPGMLALARTRISHKKIKWQEVDAQCLPFEDEDFDHVICQFGVMFFPEKQQSFTEVYRVLQKGGKYLFNVWDEMLYNPRSSIVKKVLDDMFGDEAPDFMKKGPYSFFDKGEIRNMLYSAGFQNVKIDTVKKTAVYASPDDVIIGFVEGSPLSSFMQKKPVAAQEEIRQRLQQELIAQVAVYGSALPLQALIIEAVK